MNKKTFKNFEKSIFKKASEMKKGDVIRFEYGAYDNWCKAVFESCNSFQNSEMTEIHFHWIGSNKSEKMYDTNNIDTLKFEVIGVEQ